MSQAVYLQRHNDVNGKSGIGRVWEGIIFSNGWVAGKWLSDFPSYGWYPSLKHVREIHGHSGNTELLFESTLEYGNYLLLETIEPGFTTDGCPYVAEGLQFKDGWIVLLQLAKYTSVYWYRSLEDLKKITGSRSKIHRTNQVKIIFPLNYPVWQRERIFKLTQLGVENK